MTGLKKFEMWCLVALVSLVSISGGGAAQAQDKSGKPGIVIVAFGTSVPEARKVFTYIEDSARKNFPGYDLVYGFTARSIVKKLREEGTDKGVLTLEEALAYMKKRGHDSVVLQSLHIVPGQKDNELKNIDLLGMKAVLGKPLLTSPEDMVAVLAALKKDIKPGMPNVVCGHGNDHHPEYNRMLIEFNRKLMNTYPGTLMCTVEGSPGTDALAKVIKPEVNKAGGKVNFIPLMIVAGDHIMNDVCGAEDDSWKSIIGATKISVAKSLGYNDAVLALFWQHLSAALENLKENK